MCALICLLLYISIFQTMDAYSKDSTLQNEALCNDSTVMSFVPIQVPSLFSPLRVRVDWEINGLPVEQVDESCRQLKVELRHRPFEQFLPRPVLSNALELDYDVEDGSRVLTTVLVKEQELLEFECIYFLRPGLYGVGVGNQISLKWMSINSTSAVQHPQLQLRNDSIFPHCQSDLIVSWSLPTCDPQIFHLLDFRIRVLATSSGSSWNADESLMEEFPLNAVAPNANTIAIPCAQFDIIYHKFCFELISIERKTKHFELWDRKCVSTEPVSPQQQNLESSWSHWSAWSQCTSRGYSYPEVGYRKRRRHCIIRDHADDFVEAPTKHSFCVGDLIQKENCSLIQKQADNNTFPVPMQLNVPSKNSSGGCECGCDLKKSAGLIFIGSWNCSVNNTLSWNLMTKKGQSYTLELLLLFTARKGRLKSKNVEEKIQLLKNSQMEVFWSSENIDLSQQDTFVLRENVWDDITVQFTRTCLATPHQRKHMNGVYLDYKLNPVDEIGMKDTVAVIILENLANLGSHFFDCGAGHPIPAIPVSKCEKVLVVVTALGCLLLALSLVVIPPLCCTVLTKKYTEHLVQLHHKQKGGTSSDSDALISSYSQRSDMQRSGDTDCTHLVSTQQPSTFIHVVAPVTTAGRISQRSIGIQLSRQSTPRSTSRCLVNISQPISSTTGGSGSAKTRRSTAASLTNSATGGEEEEEGELEYDYYEPAHLPFLGIDDKGGLLEEFEFVSHIDIDQIVRRETSGWLQELEQQNKEKTVKKQDAYTQI